MIGSPGKRSHCLEYLDTIDKYMLGAVLFANFHGPGGRIYSSFITCGLTGMCTWVSFWLQ